MPTITMSLHSSAVENAEFVSTRNIIAMHPESLISGLILIALLTYFYTAFSKLIQPGGEQLEKRNGSRIYYSSAAAV